MEYTIRIETPDDYSFVENLTREAFWKCDTPPRPDLEKEGLPNCDEHFLVHLLRQSPDFVKELDFIAVTPANENGGEEIIGNIMYAKSQIETPDGGKINTLTFGPLSVLPKYQRTGVGGALMRHSFEEARRLGYSSIFIYGHPEYYPRFGFENAEKYGITTEDGKNFDAFMALELASGALAGISGRLLLPAVYSSIDITKLSEFDKKFPKKAK